jgi:acyl-CoA reductase-like NAD-dependent aldehyde dehydrogenase
MRVSSALEAGTVSRRLILRLDPEMTFVDKVWVNQYNLVHCGVPFGGKKHSGFGALRSVSQPYHGKTYCGEIRPRTR